MTTDVDREAEKKVEFYAASVAAWYTSALEYDKSIFALSGGGIALLVTLLTTVGFSSWLVLSLFVCAIVCYLVCLGALLTIFRQNPKYIESILSKKGPVQSPWLRFLDLVAILAFATGTVLATGVGITTALDSFTAKLAEKGKTMATENKPSQTQTQPLRESFNGAANLQVDGRRSYNGAGGLEPGSSAPASAPAVAPTQPASTPAPAANPPGQSSSK